MSKKQSSKRQPVTPFPGKIEIVRSSVNRWPPVGTSDDITAHSFLGLNIEAPEFSERLKELKDETRDKILGVVSRLQLVNAIERESTFTFNWDRVQADALKAYLLCTCIDALAGSEYRPFHEWIIGKKQKTVLKQVLSTSSIANTLSVDGYREVIYVLIAKWRETYGVGSKFESLLQDLPTALRQELVSSYAMINEPEESTTDWEHLADDKRMDRIVEYLYELHRNTFTHQANIVPTVIAGQGVTGWV